MKWNYYLAGFALWYTIFLYSQGYFDSIEVADRITNLQAAKYFEPTPESGLTAMECVRFQNQINVIEYRLHSLMDTIVRYEHLKKIIVSELHTGEFSMSQVEKDLDTIAKIDDRMVSLKNSVQSLKTILETVNNSLKHCKRVH
jgi:hypothetical protein